MAVTEAFYLIRVCQCRERHALLCSPHPPFLLFASRAKGEHKGMRGAPALIKCRSILLGTFERECTWRLHQLVPRDGGHGDVNAHNVFALAYHFSGYLIFPWANSYIITHQFLIICSRPKVCTKQSCIEHSENEEWIIPCKMHFI